MIAARHARRDVGEDQIVPAIKRHQPVSRSQIDPRLPFFGGDLVAN